MFVKGEHERQFAYTVQTACTKRGIVLDYEVFAGNIHDSISFPKFYQGMSKAGIETLVMDAGYAAHHIYRQLILDGIAPLTPYVAPKTQKGFFKKY